ncbi:MAG: hypothetical protein CM1200mP30_31960 [Pseudomonadota bacterium]|nr:MAG: hypothetical protein CM1200mP30_31960 [Pseudomonadota bacterium]
MIDGSPLPASRIASKWNFCADGELPRDNILGIIIKPAAPFSEACLE